MKKIFTLILSLFACISFGQVQVTFLVDMFGESVSADGVHIVGSLNGWTTDANMLQDQGNGIYSVTLDLQPGQDYEYKFLNGNAWGTEEAAPPTCTVGGSNRTFTAPTADVTLPVTAFNSCPSGTLKQNVTFRVDMTGQNVSADGVHVAGNFNAWNPGGTVMNNIGNNIYEATVPVLSSLSVLQYKFINGNAWGGEETPAEGCGNGNNNRPFILKDAGENVTLPTAVFNGCANPVPTRTVVFTVNLAGLQADDAGVHVAGNFQGWSPDGTMLTEVDTDTYEAQIDIMTTMVYLEYKYLNGNAWGADEMIPSSCSYNNNRFQIIDLDDQGTFYLPNFEFGTCNGVSVSTNEVDQVALFEVTPTIANEAIWVSLIEPSLASSSIPLYLSVYNMNGETIYTETIANTEVGNKKRIDVIDWPAGLYVIRMNNGKSQYNQKVIVK